MRSSRAKDGRGAGAQDIYAVCLIDRRSGLPMRSNGALVTIYTPFPDEAAAQALQGRSAAVWEVRVERLATVETRPGSIP
jgi:hypothetical protein